MSDRPTKIPALTPERLAEIKNLLTYESSISFHSNRAHESMWCLVAEVERAWSGMCDGSSECGAAVHVHGCFSDDGRSCTEPDDRWHS